MAAHVAGEHDVHRKRWKNVSIFLIPERKKKSAYPSLLSKAFHFLRFLYM